MVIIISSVTQIDGIMNSEIDAKKVKAINVPSVKSPEVISVDFMFTSDIIPHAISVP